MLSTMVLLVLILILAQIKYSTVTGARVARNEETLIVMDHAIESALLRVYEDLKSDAEAAADTGGEQAGLPGAPAAPGGGEEGPVDSREDEWAKPERTSMNDLQLRIFIQDEDSKFNVLSLLTENEEEAERAFDRLARVIEFSRMGTQGEISSVDSESMARAILEFMNRREDQYLPNPVLVSDDEDNEDIGLPWSLRELVALDPELFPEDVFRDYRDENDRVVHSLGAFLTVWSSIGTLDEVISSSNQDNPGDQGDQNPQGDDPPGETPPLDGEATPPDAAAPPNNTPGSAPGTAPGGADSESSPGTGAGINVNTAPVAVLAGLMDSRDVPPRFWEAVIEFRNEEDEEAAEADDEEDPLLDEYGEEILTHQYFSAPGEIAEIDGWDRLEPIIQGEVLAHLKTESNVFSIYITARKTTGKEQFDNQGSRDEIEREEAEGHGLVRTVRSVVWRRSNGQSVDIIPLIRWEVLDYVPYEILDYPDDDR